MPKDKRVDAYIANSADFAKPILTHLRAVVHSACPEAEETIKWGMPHFMYKGMLCAMSAFNEHCAFGFWKHKLVIGGARPADAMGSLGRITSLKDLPPKAVLTGYIKKAKALNDDGVPARVTKRVTKPEVVVPDYLAAALGKNKKAKATFDAFSPSHRREYVEWITEAKREETRAQRMAQALEWMAEGKPRHWKYQ